jgi:hypothetical protein
MFLKDNHLWYILANKLPGIGIFETLFIRLRIEATSHPDYKHLQLSKSKTNVSIRSWASVSLSRIHRACSGRTIILWSFISSKFQTPREKTQPRVHHSLGIYTFDNQNCDIPLPTTLILDWIALFTVAWLPTSLVGDFLQQAVHTRKNKSLQCCINFK